ncbi:class I SAM-dependent methyltransferase [Spirosoma validum]|uniref:Class I SAM-dependent methyltransferase n=1 Tax=Spirosoma validum TaxID=2771355 RepID=A0A927B0T3_9BACT|nr:class I SAM-dependent methyltransferase [Spirosoma validum]MBD2753328.1 class I SAM-dependent methyltransferase [Spirosoma validum]
MQLHEAITLITPVHYVPTKPVKWADLGCGSGLFTHALASLLPTDSILYAVDTNQASLASIADHEDVRIEKIHQDFVQDEWPFNSLDGILMANSLHFVKDKFTFLEKAKRHLTESGHFLLVEYDTDTPNPWVPYPLSYVSLIHLFVKAGYKTIEKLGEMPSLYSRANLYATAISH